MARIPSGILGRLSGSISNVTGASVRGIAYIRERVTPSNPKSAAQQLQRGIFAATVLALRPFVASSIRRSFNGTVSGLTGHNVAMRQTLANIDTTFHAAALAVCDGPLPAVESSFAAESATEVMIDWPLTPEDPASGTDTVVGYLLRRDTGAVLAGPVSAERAEQLITFNGSGFPSVAELVALTYAVRNIGTAQETFSEPVTLGTPYAGGAPVREKPMKGVVLCRS